MNEETRDFLLECKNAGYEYVAICVEDKRVPAMRKIRKPGDYWGYDSRSGSTPQIPRRVVGGAPNMRDSGRPAIWGICEDSSLTAGMMFRGSGCGETHQLRRDHPLERGCYDLKEIAL